MRNRSGLNEQMQAALQEAHQEFERAVGYVNDRVVPWIRVEGQRSAEQLAIGLRRVADFLDGQVSKRWA